MSDVFVETEMDTCDSLGSGPSAVDGQGQDQEGDAEQGGGGRFDVRNLLSDGVKVEHLKDLRSAARLLDEIRQQGGDEVESELDLAEKKMELANAKSMQEMVSMLGTSEEALRAWQEYRDRWQIYKRLFPKKITTRLPLGYFAL